MQIEDPLKSLNQKEKTQWSTSWAGLPKIEMSTIAPKNMYVIPNNIFMFTKQIFENINKQML
jgi:hypothetical protein